jgi:hypothetical protein
MVDGLHIQNRTMKPLAIALRGVGKRLRERYGGGDLINVQRKLTQNCTGTIKIF